MFDWLFSWFTYNKQSKEISTAISTDFINSINSTNSSDVVKCDPKVTELWIEYQKYKESIIKHYIRLHSNYPVKCDHKISKMWTKEKQTVRCDPKIIALWNNEVDFKKNNGGKLPIEVTKCDIPETFRLEYLSKNHLIGANKN